MVKNQQENQTHIRISRACLHRNNYWKNRGVPSPKGETITGHLKFLSNPQYPSVLQIRDWSKQFGKLYGIREGWRQVLVISDPDMVQELLVKKFEYFHGRKVYICAQNMQILQKKFRITHWWKC